MQRSTLLNISIASFLLIVVIWRFWPWMPQVLAGDDLINYLAFKDGQFASTLHQALNAVYLDKYRPVFTLVMFFLFTLFGSHIKAYLIANIFIQAINAFLVYLIAYRLSRSEFISGLIALTVAVSRFALYQVVQTTGLVEGLALIFFLLMLYGAVRAAEHEEFANRWSWFAIIAAFVALNTHERYVVVIPWLMGAIVLLPTIRRKIILIGAAAAVLLLNIAYKKIILQVPFFVSTGGSSNYTPLISINLHTVGELTLQAVFSLFGFNLGNIAWVGVPFTVLPGIGIMAAVFTLALLVAIKKAISIARHEKQSLRLPLLLLALIMLLLIPPVMLTHLEQRWFVAPFILMLLLGVWAAAIIRVRSKKLGMGLIAVISLSAVILDTLYTPYFYHLFFIQSAHFSAMVKRDIVDKSPPQKTPLVFIAARFNCAWVLDEGKFFSLYGGISRTVYCFDTLKDALHSTIQANTPIYVVSTQYSVCLFHQP